jgi:hypothetical protein
MTRQYNQTFQCANCGCTTTTETSLGRWIRESKKLDSRNGFTVYDVDYIVHKFHEQSSREYQLIMLVEVKTRNSELQAAQRDTLYILNQIIENRVPNRHTGQKSHNNKHRQSRGPLKVWSAFSRRMVNVRSFGVYTLRFSGTGPLDSETIHWNKRLIDLETLEKLLAFEIEPDRFIPIEEALRNRHANRQATLFD